VNHTVMIYQTGRASEYADKLSALLPDVRLLACTTPLEAAEHISEADILFCWRFPTELYTRAAKLRWVQSMGAGVEDLVPAPLPDGCLLTRVAGLFGDYISEYAFLHMLAHAHQLHRIRANQAEGRWEPFTIGKLAGKRLGVAGVGSIGREIARKGKAFGMEVWGLVRAERPLPGFDRTFTPAGAPAFTAGVDYLVSSLPLTPQSIGLIDPTHMKPGSLLINVGRGATIDERATLAAVHAGKISAVLDVFEQEPLPVEHPFWHTPGITVTPHISGPSVPAEVAEYFAANYQRYVSGQVLTGLVDRQRGY
jgi:glyoxylate/hydroxypyruvate reductase A